MGKNKLKCKTRSCVKKLMALQPLETDQKGRIDGYTWNNDLFPHIDPGFPA